MSFKLKNASVTYQRAMNVIFHDMIDHFMEIFIDDVVVKSKGKGKHMKELRLAFKRMRKYILKMNPLKCTFGIYAGIFFRIPCTLERN